MLARFLASAALCTLATSAIADTNAIKQGQSEKLGFIAIDLGGGLMANAILPGVLNTGHGLHVGLTLGMYITPQVSCSLYLTDNSGNYDVHTDSLPFKLESIGIDAKHLKSKHRTQAAILRIGHHVHVGNGFEMNMYAGGGIGRVKHEPFKLDLLKVTPQDTQGAVDMKLTGELLQKETKITPVVQVGLGVAQALGNGLSLTADIHAIGLLTHHTASGTTSGIPQNLTALMGPEYSSGSITQDVKLSGIAVQTNLSVGLRLDL